MKAISLKQPWAWLIIKGIKDIENRKWHTDYRGPLLIHASKTWDQEGYEFIINQMDKWVPEKESHDYGKIVGMVEMIDCVGRHYSKWFFGPWGFVFEAPQCWQEPIPYRGQLGLFNISKKIFRDLFIH